LLLLAGMSLRTTFLARHLATILRVRQARVCASRHTNDDAFCQMRHSLHDAAMERAPRSEV